MMLFVCNFLVIVVFSFGFAIFHLVLAKRKLFNASSVVKITDLNPARHHNLKIEN